MTPDMKNNMVRSFASFVSLASLTSLGFTVSSPAWAAPAASDNEAPSTVVAAPAVAAPVSAGDPNLDRGFLQPTAMTQPQGSLTYNNYELLLHGFTYGVTDRLQTTVTVLSPIVTDMPFVGIASAKWRLLSAQRFHLAVQGSLGFGHLFGDNTSGNDNLYTAGAGAFASYCLREDCASLISASASYQLAMAGTDSARLHTIIYGGSIVQRVGAHVKLLGEVTSAAGKGESGVGSTDLTNMSGALLSYGVRFHTKDIASDIGFIKPIATDGNDNLLLGIPFVNVSYRWQ
jgi:hypothetical protein